jgi:RND family efflux transporter MFP subunit
MKRSPIIFVLILSGVPLFAGAEPLDCVINPNSTVELGSYQNGVLAEVLVKRGDRVARGQPLARLDNEIEKMNAELARIRAESDIAVRSGQFQEVYKARELKRLESLRESQSVSTSSYEQAEIDHNLAAMSVESARLEKNIAKAEYERAKAQLQRRTIRSPVDGVVVDVVMSPGEYVYEQSTLMSIAAIDPLYVEVYLPVASYSEIRDGMTAVVRPEQPIGGEYTAKIAVIDQVFDASSRTFGVRLELPNPEFKLPAGVRCTVEFETSPEAD